ncbi:MULTISPECIES: hypothetical protein [Alkalihalophilus]|uniref:Lipoprotein n=1 Tax=Alkalihalophilus pseudofirmus (strain ATCC BAA-2126 / JCM 17055 / OF4) TaxID=398511 RepID=D3G1L4_ALKPO|nr:MULTISPECIES: hypothetical protein [Alkalihalophilus]ADC52240.1 hypothetical protein BpOF4_21224 [Alkalihalophilus pseudofirmus OF4]MEC2074352.1 hypothetical protein [Alkalihalophilus marmarensis]
MNSKYLISVVLFICIIMTGCGTSNDNTSLEESSFDSKSSSDNNLSYDETIEKIISEEYKISFLGDFNKLTPPHRFENMVENVEDLGHINSNEYIASIIMADQFSNVESTEVLNLIESGVPVFIDRSAITIEELIKWIEGKDVPDEMGESRSDEELVYVLKDKEGEISYGVLVPSKEDSDWLSLLYKEILYVSYTESL